MTRHIALIVALTLAASAASAQPCPAGKRPLVILGTFHMQPSGEDAVNRKEDVSTPARQKEIADLVTKLARFRPTRIAIESARNSTTWNDRYKQWLAGNHTLGMNEIEQVGFRLTKQLELPGLTPVDYPMWMSGLTPIERHEPPKKAAPPTPPPPAPPALEEAKFISVVEAQIAKDIEHLATHTVAEHLAYLNEPSRAKINHSWDVLSNLRPGDGVALYEKTDLVTNWYKRNLRIFTNILDSSTPDDRILLIIGMGHAKILSDWAADHPDVCLVPVGEYLK